MSAHTDICMDKHKIDVHALPIFRRQTERDVQNTHKRCTQATSFFPNTAPQEAKWGSFNMTKTLEFIVKGVLGAMHISFFY